MNSSFKYRLLVLLIITIVSIWTGMGCDSEETTVESYLDTINVTLLDTVWNPMMIWGRVEMNPFLRSYMSVVSLGDYFPEIDSVFLGDSVMTISHRNFGHPTVDMSYYNKADSVRFNSGDIIAIELYSPFGNGNCNLKLLDQSKDSIILIEPNKNDTITVGQSQDLVWAKVSSADWYTVAVRVDWDSSGERIYDRYVFEITDTTYTLNSGLARNDGYMYIDVYPLTGPMSTEESGNITGELKGSIHSIGAGGYSQIRINPPAGQSSKPGEMNHKQESIEDILNTLFDR